jgi:hypothetical protein
VVFEESASTDRTWPESSGEEAAWVKASEREAISDMHYAHVFLLCCSLLALETSSAAAECLKDNVEGQSAAGQLTVMRAQDAAGRPERPYILRLAATACLDADDPDDAVKSTRTIHVFPAEPKLQPSFHKLVGKMVVVRGSPFAQHTAHHHAPIVMQVTEINQR